MCLLFWFRCSNDDDDNDIKGDDDDDDFAAAAADDDYDDGDNDDNDNDDEKDKGDDYLIVTYCRFKYLYYLICFAYCIQLATWRLKKVEKNM